MSNSALLGRLPPVFLPQSSQSQLLGTNFLRSAFFIVDASSPFEAAHGCDLLEWRALLRKLRLYFGITQLGTPRTACPAAHSDPVVKEQKRSREGGMVAVFPNALVTDHTIGPIWVGRRCAGRTEVLINHDLAARAIVDVATGHMHSHLNSPFGRLQ